MKQMIGDLIVDALLHLVGEIIILGIIAILISIVGEWVSRVIQEIKSFER